MSLAVIGAADSTIMAIAGHVSSERLGRYSYARTEASHAAIETITNSSRITARKKGFYRCNKCK